MENSEKNEQNSVEINNAPIDLPSATTDGEFCHAATVGAENLEKISTEKAVESEVTEVYAIDESEQTQFTDSSTTETVEEVIEVVEINDDSSNDSYAEDVNSEIPEGKEELSENIVLSEQIDDNTAKESIKDVENKSDVNSETETNPKAETVVKPAALIAELDKLLAKGEDFKKVLESDAAEAKQISDDNKQSAPEQSITDKKENSESVMESKEALAVDEKSSVSSLNNSEEVIEEKSDVKDESVSSENGTDSVKLVNETESTPDSAPASISTPESVISAEPSSDKDSNVVEELEPKSNKQNSFFKQYRINREFWKSFAGDVVFILLCVFFVFSFFQKWIASKQSVIEGINQSVNSIESGEKSTVGNINILMMGIDSVEGTHRSDTIFVLGVNPSKRKITMLSIPRDTLVYAGDKARKINEILPRYGEPVLRKMIEDLLKINISRKAEVGFESFISVIDALGGVDINIEKAMNYDDNWGNLHIHFKPGMNHLNGRQALNYVRFRKDAMADLGRIKRQQSFVKAVIKKLMSPSSIVKLPSIIEKVFQYIKTDFTISEILTIVNGFDSFDIKIQTLSLPGEAEYRDKISYFIPFSDKAKDIADSYFSDFAVFELEKPYESDKIIPLKSTSNRKKNK